MRSSDVDNPKGQQTLMFGIGAQKAGTTWLQSQLEGQNGVFLARPKELHYWDCIRSPYLNEFRVLARKRMHVPVAGDPLRYRLSRLWHPELRQRVALANLYAKIYDSPPYDHAAYKSYVGLGRPGARLVGDITPSYALLSRDTYSEMLGCSEDVCFVFIMRDPVTRLWSGLHQKFRPQLGRSNLKEHDLTRRFESICRTPLDPNFLRSDYPKTITELEAVVPEAQIHYCFFETLLDPLKGKDEREKLAQFLGVPAESFDPTEKVHSNKNAYQLSNEGKVIARRSMEGIYATLYERFGSQLPSNWDL